MASIQMRCHDDGQLHMARRNALPRFQRKKHPEQMFGRRFNLRQHPELLREVVAAQGVLRKELLELGTQGVDGGFGDSWHGEVAYWSTEGRAASGPMKARHSADRIGTGEGFILGSHRNGFQYRISIFLYASVV
jgi:hypothetical protein